MDAAQDKILIEVSIHASTWEATRSLAGGRTLRWLFQSTPPHGRRQRPPPSPRRHRSFNPRLHMGGDWIHAWPALADLCTRFNPRLHMGGDSSHDLG